MNRAYRFAAGAAIALIVWGLLPSDTRAGIMQAVIPQVVPTPNKQGNGTKFQLAAGSTTTNDYLKYDSGGNAIDSGIPAVAPPQITQGTFAGISRNCTTNDLYLITSGLLNFARCFATDSWNFFYGGHLITPAASLIGFSTSGTAATPSAVDQTHGYDMITVNAGGTTNMAERLWVAPTAPYTVVIVIRPPAWHDSTQYRQWSAGFADNAGKAFTITCGNDGQNVSPLWCGLRNLNADGSFNAEIVVEATVFGYPAGTDSEVQVCLKDDNTNIFIGITTNYDTTACVYIGSEGRTSFLTAPTKLEYGVLNSGAGANMTNTLVGVLQ